MVNNKKEELWLVAQGGKSHGKPKHTMKCTVYITVFDTQPQTHAHTALL